MKSIAMFIAIIPLICLIACILLYNLNRKNYHNLLNELQKENVLPVFYSYHSSMGFFGAPVMAYLFLRIKNNKKIFFINEGNDIYNFTNKNNNKDLINGIIPFYYTFLTGLGFTCILCFIGLMIKLQTAFIS